MTIPTTNTTGTTTNRILARPPDKLAKSTKSEAATPVATRTTANVIK
jgi:hypothetical protein